MRKRIAVVVGVALVIVTSAAVPAATSQTSRIVPSASERADARWPEAVTACARIWPENADLRERCAARRLRYAGWLRTVVEERKALAGAFANCRKVFEDSFTLQEACMDQERAAYRRIGSR